MIINQSTQKLRHYFARTDEMRAKNGLSSMSVHQLVRFAEDHAILLRGKAHVAPMERLDPWSLTEKYLLKIVRLDDIQNLSKEDYHHICGVDPKVWSGMGGMLPNGETMVILHPLQTPERANVTVMEEVAHAHLGHKPSQLVAQSNGLTKRTYNEQIEQEAYWTAAATLLPAKVIARAVWRRQPVEKVAADYGASVELVEFRIKVLNLWPEYSGQVP